MIGSLTLVIAMACPEPKIVNNTKDWDNSDKQVFETAKNRCKELYGNEAPCLIIFTKVSEDTYRALCGESR